MKKCPLAVRVDVLIHRSCKQIPPSVRVFMIYKFSVAHATQRSVQTSLRKRSDVRKHQRSCRYSTAVYVDRMRSCAFVCTHGMTHRDAHKQDSPRRTAKRSIFISNPSTLMQTPSGSVRMVKSTLKRRSYRVVDAIACKNDFGET